ncbi:hypothetical protein MBO_01155 [Moraxella bovoculi 237]|uniref:Uncharacterized protein n=1 Tax=Moraxella bovoculi 237 TaxID=743974 RepID=A0A066UEE1_9GAMM|nr:hypothetical protein MBO_01155 [Moraxella bovoculi 237]
MDSLLLLFQHTHPYGVRFVLELWASAFKAFQHTHPYGVRFTTNKSKGKGNRFNTRTRMGCDLPLGNVR